MIRPPVRHDKYSTDLHQSGVNAAPRIPRARVPRGRVSTCDSATRTRPASERGRKEPGASVGIGLSSESLQACAGRMSLVASVHHAPYPSRTHPMDDGCLARKLRCLAQSPFQDQSRSASQTWSDSVLTSAEFSGLRTKVGRRWATMLVAFGRNGQPSAEVGPKSAPILPSLGHDVRCRPKLSHAQVARLPPSSTDFGPISAKLDPDSAKIVGCVLGVALYKTSTMGVGNGRTEVRSTGFWPANGRGRLEFAELVFVFLLRCRSRGRFSRSRCDLPDCVGAPKIAPQPTSKQEKHRNSQIPTFTARVRAQLRLVGLRTGHGRPPASTSCTSPMTAPPRTHT